MLNISELESEFDNLKSNFKNFATKLGTKQILISCPHSASQTRNGIHKSSEPETALLAIQLNKLGFPILLKTSNENDDANYDLALPYKSELLKIINENSIKFVLDLHQLNPKREIDICLGTGGDSHKNLLNYNYLIKPINEYLEKSGFLTTINNPFGATKINTISAYLASNNIPAIQVEMNSKILTNHYGKEFEKVYNSLLLILNYIEEEIKNENISNK